MEEKIKEIMADVETDGSYDFSESQKEAIRKLLSLFKNSFMEIVGEDEKLSKCDEHEVWLDTGGWVCDDCGGWASKGLDTHRPSRNQLRQELRERIKRL